MKKTTKFSCLLTALAISGAVMAQNNDGVTLVAKDASGGTVGSVPVYLDSNIKFTSSGVNVLEKEVIKTSFKYSDISTLYFYTQNSVGTVLSDANSLYLVNNPVEEVLRIKGYSDTAALTVSDIRGTIKISIPEWCGEDVYVNTLTPGLYLVTINDKTLKFIKK